MPSSLLLVPLESLVPCCSHCRCSCRVSLPGSQGWCVPPLLLGSFGYRQYLVVQGWKGLGSGWGAAWFSVAVDFSVARRSETPVLPRLLLLSSPVRQHRCSQGLEPESQGPMPWPLLLSFSSLFPDPLPAMVRLELQLGFHRCSLGLWA